MSTTTYAYANVGASVEQTPVGYSYAYGNVGGVQERSRGVAVYAYANVAEPSYPTVAYVYANVADAAEPARSAAVYSYSNVGTSTERARTADVYAYADVVDFSWPDWLPNYARIYGKWLPTSPERLAWLRDVYVQSDTPSDPPDGSWWLDLGSSPPVWRYRDDGSWVLPAVAAASPDGTEWVIEVDDSGNVSTSQL